VYPDFKELLLTFNAHDVEYLIVGAVIKRKRKILVLAATLVAAIPLGYILTTQP